MSLPAPQPPDPAHQPSGVLACTRPVKASPENETYSSVCPATGMERKKQESKMRRDQLNDDYLELLDKQRLYYKTVKDFKEGGREGRREGWMGKKERR
ncbi:hypothetical protein CRUP_014145 [Coryphaenoides rupestris]|nr:hypothetical protein CRUP_014145 [Coryphaenoides rupestris]